MKITEIRLTKCPLSGVIWSGLAQPDGSSVDVCHRGFLRSIRSLWDVPKNVDKVTLSFHSRPGKHRYQVDVLGFGLYDCHAVSVCGYENVSTLLLYHVASLTPYRGRCVYVELEVGVT